MAGRPASALTKARIELIQAQRDGQELKNAQLRGELVIIEEVERSWSDILRVMRTGLLALPSRVAQRLPHLTRGDKAAIEDEIRAILEELAAAGPEAGSGGAEAAPEAISEHLDRSKPEATRRYERPSRTSETVAVSAGDC